MTDPRASIGIVVAERGADQFLHQIPFFVGAARRNDAADCIAAIFGLDALELAGGVADGFFPADFAPRIGDLGADHGLRDAILVRRVPPREAALHARVAVVRLAVLKRNHADHFRALHFRLERAAHAAIRAGGDNRVFSLAFRQNALFDQRRRGTRLYARSARYTFGIEERLAAGGNFGFESASLNGQREGPLHFLASPHAARAHDALGRLETEIRIRIVLRFGMLEMILAIVTVADFTQSDHARHILQLAVSVRSAGQAIERMVRDIQLHHSAAEL